MDRIVRVFTSGKAAEDIAQNILRAIQNGCRVLVKAGGDGENSAIAAWAEALSHEHGLIWERVGPDVLFAKAA